MAELSRHSLYMEAAKQFQTHRSQMGEVLGGSLLSLPCQVGVWAQRNKSLVPPSLQQRCLVGGEACLYRGAEAVVSLCESEHLAACGAGTSCPWEGTQ